MTVASQDVQNPAYRPTPPLHRSSPPARFLPRRWWCVDLRPMWTLIHRGAARTLDLASSGAFAVTVVN